MMITADGNLIGTLTDANGTAFDINGMIENPVRLPLRQLN